MATKFFSDSTTQHYNNDTKRECVFRVKGGYGPNGEYTQEEIDKINAALNARTRTFEEIDFQSTYLIIERIYQDVIPNTNVDWFASHFRALRDAGKF